MNEQEQLELVRTFNWDDSWEPILQILRSPDCPLEVVLLAFWRLEGPWYYLGEGGRPRQSEILDELISGIEGGRYRPSSLSYSPITDQSLSNVQVYKLKKAGLPDIYFGEPSPQA